MASDSRAGLAIVGNLNVDQVVETVTRFPEWDEELLVSSSRRLVAGTAGYMALASAALGDRPYIVSTIGDDEAGEFLIHNLHDVGIETDGVDVISGKETPLGIVFVGEGGKRAILSVLGAHEDMSVAVAKRHTARVVECGDVILCGNYLLPQFTPSMVVDYVRDLREQGVSVAFDPSWDPGGWETGMREETYELLANIDVFLPNDEELLRLTNADSLDEAIRQVAEFGCDVVVKCGALGAMGLVGGKMFTADPLAVTARNTIGAGDVFDVGYLHARRKGLDAAASMSFACAVAAMVIEQHGEREYPNEAQVLARMESAHQ